MSESASRTGGRPEWRLAPALQEGEQHFRRLLEKLPAGAYTCDPAGLITYFNQSAVDLWGRAPKLNDPVDRFCGSFKLFAVDGAPIPHEQCWMALALKQDREYNGHEIIIERPDGTRLAVLSHANPIRDDAGNLLGAVNVLVDITDCKRTEDALKAEDRAKNEFLATLAHELRNPLAPVRNAVEILRLKVPASRESKWALEVIDRQTRQMTRLVDDLLDLARITSDKLTLQKGRIGLAEVVNAAIETSRPVIDASGQELTVKLPEQLISIDGDLTRLAQVISNLLNNAAKYTAPDGRITLTAEREGSEVLISVRDTGIGIPSEMLPRIFDMFAQVDHSLERSQGGLGIGLTLAKRLVDMHGGTITARSEGPWMGSEFTVRLPILAEPKQTQPGAGREVEPALPGSSLRIVVVDDNRDAADSLGIFLSLMGNEVRTAPDGFDALALAKEFLPDVILLDIGLPRMNGYETARAVRREPWGRRIILIAVTGWGQEADKQRSKEAGFDYHLVKPVDPTALLGLLDHSARGVSGAVGPH